MVNKFVIHQRLSGEIMQTIMGFFSSKNCFSPIALLFSESTFDFRQPIHDLLTAMVAGDYLLTTYCCWKDIDIATERPEAIV